MGESPGGLQGRLFAAQEPNQRHGHAKRRITIVATQKKGERQGDGTRKMIFLQRLVVRGEETASTSR